MNKRVIIGGTALLVMVLGLVVQGQSTGQRGASAVTPATRTTASAYEAQQAVLNDYCVECHNKTAKTAGLMLDKADLNDIPGGGAIWEKVVLKLRAGMMPPLGRPRPDQAAVDSMVALLERHLDQSAKARPDPGRASIHRLNRTEYGNAVRDLLRLEIDARELLHDVAHFK